MSDISSTIQQTSNQASQLAGDWVVPLARIGYVAKGVVYAVIGTLAVLAAVGAGGQTTGSSGAVRAVSQQPYGAVLLGLLAAGLFAYTAWRFAQAFFNAECDDYDAKGIGKRLQATFSGFTYGLLGVSAIRMALSGASSSGGGGGSKQALTAQLMSAPAGQWLVAAVGVIVIGVGIRQFQKAYKSSFMKKYATSKMSSQERRVARRAGQFGLGSRGVVFGIIGTFFIQAAIRQDPSEARGLDAALSTLASQPYGQVLLGIVATGLVAYGVHCLVKARYRTFASV